MKRIHRKKLALAVANAVSAGAAIGLAAPLVYGQQPAPPAAPPVEKLQKIVVTGSLIPLQTLESESPVEIITARDIAFTGLSDTSDILAQLPFISADLGSRNLGSISTVSLRGLGSTRTLVLINGRRLPAADPGTWLRCSCRCDQLHHERPVRGHPALL